MHIKKEYKIRNIAGENIVVSIGTLDVNLTKVITLNTTSKWLWEQLEGKEFSVEDVSALLTDNFEVDSETALSDSYKWIDALMHHGIIEE